MQHIHFLIFYAASFLFYITDVLQKTTSNKQYTWSYIFHRSLYTTVVASFASLFIFGINGFPDISTALKILGVSFLCALGFFYYIKAVNTTNFSNVGALSIIGNVFQILIGIILFKESFTWWMIPVLLLMSTGNLIQLISVKHSKGAIDVLLSVFFWTMGYTALSRVLQNVNVTWSVPLMEFAILLLSGLMVLIKKEKYYDNNNKAISYKIKMFIIGVFIFCASYLNNLSFQQIPVSVISLLQLSMLPIGYLISLKIFREKPTTIELVSFISGFAGFALYVWMKG